MGGVAMFITRMLAQAFPGGLRDSTAPSSTSSGPTERTVGTGASNETFVTIGGVAHLFVDEGDCVVEFEPAFDETPGDTMFGTKILPALAPHWALIHEHSAPLKDAIATAIRRESLPTSTVSSPASTRASTPAVPLARVLQSVDEPQPAVPAERERHRALPAREPGRLGGLRDAGGDVSHSAAVKGRITSWGEEEFPNRRPGGPDTYKSFAMHLDTRNGARVLQGEGLKDAINTCGCSVGDMVSVKRLRKIKVAAFGDDGSPIMKNGQQVMWDKWLWSITK
ncbi:hypothetical protein F3J11_00140 [Burkholderia sp. Cy-647]|uniref:hypothetical protein n=2 Tax=Burkholderia TaxID=32008 RepID=UPI0014226E35|nr:MULTISPECIES: hypothetical protein [unclassified Burkholderia]NIE81899.1 hypothetical protein [Burkholderia sp. Tr-860]NIF61137.1 hypothetical protein [Burkholderia sp. Cy-647]NIF93990.1 hypothetical protein [Burkholderia sp. Ax-1720]